MRTESVQYFTDKEEAFVNLLIEIGTKKNVAKMIVFLANVPEATSMDLERGTDLRQPEVSIAMKYLADQGWIKEREKTSESKDRPMKVYELAVPVMKIIRFIEDEKKKEAKNQLALVGKLREYIR
ncbi:MAG: ArsR family transcriptional regulator [Methanoregula sp.]